MAESHPQDFHFYAKCAKPLILALTTVKERSLASAWIKRLGDDKALSENLRQNYLKLLIYFLQKRTLDGPFLSHPSKFEVLDELPKNQNVYETIKGLKKKKAQPYSSDFSADLRTYVAYQEIENVGAQCYFALSKQPLTVWDNFDPSLFPLGRKAGGVKAAHFVEEEAPIDEDLEAKKQEFVEEIEKKIKNESKKVMFMVSPIGKVREAEDRMRPSWGSNLIQLDKKPE